MCQGISRCIKERYPAIHLVGEDINPNCGWKASVDSFVLQGKKSKALDFPYQQEGLMAAICNDKILTNDLLVSNGISAPYTAEGPFKTCFQKPRWGQGGKGFGECYQELLIGDEITVPVYCTKNGTLRIIQLQRCLVSGTTSWAKVIDNKQIAHLCSKVAKLLGFKGAFNIQLMLTKKGPMIFEINPRFSSTVFMRHCLGFEDAVWALEELMGWELSAYKPPAVGTEVVRVHGAAIL